MANTAGRTNSDKNTHISNMTGVNADTNIYSATSSVVSNAKMVVFGDDNFTTSTQSAVESGSTATLDHFGDLFASTTYKFDFIFVRQNNLFDYFVTAGKNESRTDYGDYNATGNNLKTNLEDLIVDSFSGNVYFVGFGLGGAFASVRYGSDWNMSGKSYDLKIFSTSRTVKIPANPVGDLDAWRNEAKTPQSLISSPSSLELTQSIVTSADGTNKKYYFNNRTFTGVGIPTADTDLQYHYDNSEIDAWTNLDSQDHITVTNDLNNSYITDIKSIEDA